MFTLNNTILVVIDVQGNLASQVFERDKIFHNINGSIKLAKLLDIPIIVTEQVPDKIGKTVPEITQSLGIFQPIIKKSFSAWLEPNFVKSIRNLKRKQILICGIETHVCIYQTVADLIEANYEVAVIADAVSSRTSENRQLALDQIRNLGAQLVGIEMIATELLRTSEHPKFREVLKLIK